MLPLPDGPADKLIYRQRISTFAGSLDGAGALPAWASRMTLLGLLARPELLAAADVARGDKAMQDKIAEQARTAGGADDAALWGTTVHAAVEQILGGERAVGSFQDPVLAMDVEAVLKAMAPYEVVGLEVFVDDSTDLLAGSCDYVLRRPDGRVVLGDLKTSSWEITRYGLDKAAVQLCAYSRARPYCHAENYWYDWPEDFDDTRGVVIHCPKGSGEAKIVDVNLVTAQLGVELALGVRTWRKTSSKLVVA